MRMVECLSDKSSIYALQLLLPLALARGGSFTTTEPSGHTRTNVEILREFLPVSVVTEPVGPGRWHLQLETQFSP